MGIKGLAHICISSKDLQKTEDFYYNKIGLKKIFDFNKNDQIAGFYIKLSDNNFLEFIQDDKDYSNDWKVITWLFTR